MRRADRLLQLIQILRRSRRPVTAEVMAHELEVSVRTIYRDIGSLIGARVPVRGEAGIGYVLADGYDLPPMMFTADEVEAVLVGMRWVEMRGDEAMSKAARDVLSKVGAVLPETLRPVLLDGTLAVPETVKRPPADRINVAELRRAIREGRKVAIDYQDEKGAPSTRLIWPLALAYFDLARIVVAWCELRNDFRHFRTDRMSTIDVCAGRYPGQRAVLLRRWQALEQSRANATDSNAADAVGQTCAPSV